MSLRVGNRLLATLPGQDTRPTTARVRSAVCNIWQGDIAGCRWLDLCAGVGAMGAEAIARGAAHVVGIERSARACALIEKNWARLARPGQTFVVWRGDVLAQLPRLVSHTAPKIAPPGLGDQGFDRIYFDPPYASDLYGPTLAAIAQAHLLTDHGQLAVELAAGAIDRFDQITPPGLVLLRHKVYGNTAIAFFGPHE